jgi:hypothetical protein
MKLDLIDSSFASQKNLYQFKDKSLLDMSSRIIKNSDENVFNNRFFRVNEGSFCRGKNHNKIVLDKLLEKGCINWSKLNFVNNVEYEFLRYLCNVDVDSKGLVLCNDDNELILNRLNTKFNVKYKAKVIRRMRYLAYKFKKSNCVLLTLTLDPKKYDDNLVMMWNDIKKQQNNFFRKLRHHLKKSNRRLPKYVSTIECQHGEGSWMNPHIHILFFDCSRLMDWRKIRDIWKIGHIFINRTKEGKKIRNPVDYITKYITKTYTDTSRDNILDQAIQWFFNIRSFSYSSGLIFPINYCVGNLIKVFFLDTCSKYVFIWWNDNLSSLVGEYYYNKNFGNNYNGKY